MIHWRHKNLMILGMLLVTDWVLMMVAVLVLLMVVEWVMLWVLYLVMLLVLDWVLPLVRTSCCAAAARVGHSSNRTWLLTSLN